nr:hypothetical protein GCM10025699_10210 [Microbacterium flavescens]
MALGLNRFSLRGRLRGAHRQRRGLDEQQEHEADREDQRDAEDPVQGLVSRDGDERPHSSGAIQLAARPVVA